MNNYAVSSDGIATALQDSASALMEGGNNLEQAVAMVAAANKVVQDPNSVGSALRTISLRLRGTSLEVLEEMGEETDGVIESTSKLQAKIKALTGVDILTESGAYKETYTILAEIGQVWEDMADIDQAALLELMAGKNRANTLAAILGNMDDLKGAYESALNAEGSALKENESYLDSIQGRLDLFTNSVQTMWMNTLSSETVKDFVSFGTALIELVDKFGLLETVLAGIATYFTTFSKNKIDLASMLGIHNLDKTFFKGFSAIGKQGLTGWVANLFKGKTVGNQITEKIFDPDSLRVSAADFAAAIQNNIDDYVTIDTTKIDSEIDGIQHKLQVARKQLDDARSRDWKYYKTMGSKTPAKDKNNAIDEKVNEINRLENELLELQRTRDDIVNSAVSNVATSMSTSIDNDVKSYKSMLSVLSEVKNTKLYLGDEQYAAQQIDLMSQAAKNGQLSLAGYVSSLGDADIALKAYAASVQDGNYSLAGFQQFIAQHNAQLKASGVAAKAAAVGHTILNAALSMGISLLVSSVFSFVIEKFSQIGEYAQRAAEAVGTYNEEQKKFNSQKKTVDELAKSYQKLSSGVNTSTNDNIGLTSESYEEYLGVCNDIADMFPELIAGYDAEGNAILTLKGKVDSLTEAYENMAKASSAKFLTQDNKEDIWKSYNKVVNKDRSFLPSGTKQEHQATLELLDKLTNEDFEHLLGLSSGINSIFASDTKEAYGDKGKFLDFLETKGFTGDGTRFTNFLNDVDLDFEGIAEQIENGDITLTEGINTLRSNISVALSNVNSDIAAAMSDIKQTVSAKLLWDPDYQALDDNTKKMASTIVNNLNPDMISQMGATSIDDLATKLMSDLKGADQDIVEGIYDVQTDIVKAITDGDEAAFNTAKSTFEGLIPEDWRDGKTGEITIDENSDAVTQFLQRTAKEIENQSKNYEIKLQFKADYESSLAKSPENDYDKDYATKVQEAERIVKAYNDAVTGLGQLGFDSTQTVFGNIDTNNRHVLEWTEENLNKYRSIIESWGQNVDDYVDSYSTVLGSLGTFEGVEIAFSPMLQTSEGAVLLDSNTVNKYIFDLIDKARMDDGAFDATELFALDAEGLDIEGTYIHGLIAAVGDEAEAISQAMHFTGTDGAITVGWDMIAEAAEKAGVSVEQYVAAVQNANWEQIGIDVPEIPEAVTASELLSDTDANTYIANARKMSKESYALAEAQQTMVKALAGDDGILYSDELVDMYDQWVEAGNKAPKDSDWTKDQIAGIKILDALINNFNTDIDTVKQGLIDVGLVSRSLSDITPFNLSSEATQDTVTKFEENIASIKEAWNALNDGSLTKSEFIELAMEMPEIMEGVDLSDDNWMVKAKENLEELNQTKIDDFIDRLQQMKAAMKEDGQDTSVVDSFINYATQLKTQPLLDAEANTKPDTISGLKAEYESYIALVEEANEIIYDGQKISSDYYESLREYIDDVEELDDCFDKNNKNIVTNAKKLKQLIAQQKQETLNTVRLARAQSQLEYQDLVQELYDATNAYENNTAAGFDQINSLLEQIDTVQSTIDKYKLLELSLLGATNAFEEFQNAQEIDSETDYEGSVEEMIQALGEGFDSGKVGTHTFNAAIQGLLPESFSNPTDSGDLDAVWKEFTKGNLSKFFTYSEDDGFDITLKNLKNFVAEAQKVGVMDGEGFKKFWVESGTSLEEFAEKMGLSKEATFAFLEMLSDYSIGGESLTSKLADVQYDTEIEEATDELNEAIEKKAELLRSGKYDPTDMEEFNKDIEDAQARLDKANQDAIAHASQYTTLAALQNGLSGEVSMTKEQLDNLAVGLSEITGKTYTISADGKSLLDAEGNVVDIQAMLEGLGETPTVLEVQLAYKDMQEELEELNRQKELIEKDPAEAKIQLGAVSDADLQSKKKEINGQIAAIQEQMKVLEVQYDVQPPSEEDTSIIEKFETLEKDGVKTTVTVDATEATGTVDDLREKAEAPMETTITVNTETGTTTTTTDTQTEATVNFTVGTGFDDVLQKIALIKQATSVPITQQVTVSDGGTVSAVATQVTDLNNQVVENKTFEVSDNNTIEAEKIDVLDLEATNIADKTFSVSMDGYTTVKSQLDTVISKLSTIDGMSATATVTVKTIKTKTGEDELNGNFHIGGAFSSGTVGAPRTEEALVGELGPELLVRGNRWTTIGENGAEFTQIQKGDIIFNHKQTEQLLKNGYISSRGKAYASGTAYNTTYTDHYNWTGNQNTSDSFNNTSQNLNQTSQNLNKASDKVSEAANDFKETFDWIEVRLEEINEKISLKEAKLENAVGTNAKNKIIDSLINDNKKLYDNLIAGANKYYSHASTLLNKIPEAYREAAKDGSIAIKEFAGDAGEETMNAIQEYREWVQKGADATQQAEETLTEIRELAQQAFDNISDRYDLKNDVTEAKNAKIEAQIELTEEKGEPVTSVYYNAMKTNTEKLKERKQDERNELQAELDRQVALGAKNGGIDKYSDEWFEMVAQIFSLDEEIIQLDKDLESYQNSLNELHWNNFDTQIERLQNVADETQNVIDLLGEKDLFDDSGEWTDEGIASIGLLGQQMENAKLQANMYKKEMADLEDRYNKGLISESEYTEKMAEYKNELYDCIEAYNDSADAIEDLQKARVEQIKKGIDKEIEAYEKLIKKKKEALDADKDAHDFAKSAMEHQKNIAELERKIAALAGDTSASAAAERARLEADLAEARAEQEEFYYDRSVANQQEAYDKSLENFQEEKEAEKEGWDEWLEDTSTVIGDAFSTLQENAATVNQTLIGLADEYGLKLSDAIVSPWEDGQTTMGSYWSSFTTLGSDAITSLKTELQAFKDALSDAKNEAQMVITGQHVQNMLTIGPKSQQPADGNGNGNNGNGNNGNGNNGDGNGNTGTPTVGSTVTVKSTATHFGSKSGNKKMASFVPGGTYTVYEVSGTGANAQVLIGKNGSYTGWVKVSDLTGYSTTPTTNPTTNNPPKIGASVTVKTSATNYSTNSGGKKMASFVPGGKYTVMETAGSGDKTQVLIGKNGVATGWVWMKDLKGYAKGTTGVKQSQLAWIDELGEELVMHADGSGKLAFLSKGSSVIPHDLTENLMSWGSLDPSNMLEQNRPSIGVSPEVHNTEINLDCSVGTLVNIEHCDQGTLPDVEKMVNKAFEKHMQTLNNSIKKFVR